MSSTMGPTGTFMVPVAGSFTLFGRPTGPTAAGSFAGVGSFGVPTGPTAAGSFAGVGSFGVPTTGPTAAGSFVGPAGPTSKMGRWVKFYSDAHIEALEAETVPRPPPLGELILCFFIRPEHQEERLASYEERFHVWTRKFGARKARRLYYRWAFQSIFDILTIGAIGAVIDWIYDRLSGN
jgi:hypothetical protein